MNIPGQPTGVVPQDAITGPASLAGTAGIIAESGGSIYLLRTAIEALMIQVMILNQTLASSSLADRSMNTSRFSGLLP